jgi:AAA+ ATPase superfamily predicted ATPase
MCPTGKHFEQIPNPYVVGNPIRDEKMFYGRQDDFDYIRRKITSGEQGGLLVLCGARRSGKTSILLQIQSGRLGEEFLPLFVDMQSITVSNDSEFLTMLAGEIAGAMGDREITIEDFAPLLADDPYKAFSAFTAAVNDQLGGKKLVLMFDEYELFENLIEEGRLSTAIFRSLANWMEQEGAVFVILAGSDKINARRPHYWRAFLSKAFVNRRLTFLSKDDTYRLVLEPLDGTVRHAADVPERVYEVTAGQPFYTQALCQAIIDRLNELRKHDATAEDVKEVVDEIIENPLPQMVFTWDMLTEVEKLAMATVAELTREGEKIVTPSQVLSYPGKVEYEYRFVKAALLETLEGLFHDDFLHKDKAREAYSFRMDLWRRWVRRMHSFWEVASEIDSDDEEPAEGFRRPVKPSRRVIAAIGISVFVVLAITIPMVLRWVTPTSGTGAAIAMDSTSVHVSTEPPTALVWLDEAAVGRTPFDGVVAVGVKELLIEHDGYHSIRDTLELVKGEPYRGSFTLDSLTGGVDVTSAPSGALIWLNAIETAHRTPHVFPALAVGVSHMVELRLPGYSRVRRSLQVALDSTVAWHHDFVRATHPLTVASDPSGAEVYLDDTMVGRTPVGLQAVTAGVHVLELRLAGYQTARNRIEVPAPDGLIERTLTKLPLGVLVVHVEPYGTVSIDGEVSGERGIAFHAVELEPGPHQLEIQHPLTEPHRTSVIVVSADTVHVWHRFELRPTDD